MKSIKKYPKYSEGGVADTSLYNTVKNENEKKKKMKDLEAAIAAHKGTPKGRELVKQYRALTGTK